ncbi:MAG TPA: LamG-like jellyroll fold domain-containing protein, partial [Blastocatellia bacterium]|nr:LamG-like jellyroll fold domain-containing protein [Blastocatellia bacterium]
FADGIAGFDAPQAESASSNALNTWEQWAVVFDRALGQVRFFKNGALDATRTLTFPGPINQMDPVLIGADKSSGGLRFLQATVDDVRVWNVARTAGQIQASFNQELQGNETGLVAYWNFNAGNANDLTANANNGALSASGATIGNPADRKFLTGNRQSTFTLPASTFANTSSISWVQTTPAGTSIKIETSLDNGSTFQTATNGGGIPSLTLGDELGWAIATGDVNKDGGGDLLLGAPFANVIAGNAFRAQAGIVYVLPSTASPPPINHPPIVHLTAPNGGESLFVGQNVNITWAATDPDGDSNIKKFQLKLSTDGGANFNFTINPNVVGTARQFAWTVPPGFNTTQGRIRVIATDAGDLSAQDDSDGNFTITDVGVTATVTAPNGRENLKFNQRFTITWTVPAAVQSLVKGFDIFLSTDGGGSFSKAIAASNDPAQPAVLPTTRSFDWMVDSICTTRARVSIVTTSTANVRTSDMSDADFSISAPGPTIDTANMFLFGDFQLFLLTTTPAGGTEITFTEDTTVEVSSDAAGTTFFSFSKPGKIKRNGEKFLSKGTINNGDLGVLFPNGATRVIRITRPTCAITILRVTRSGEQLMLAASAQAESATVWN